MNILQDITLRTQERIREKKKTLPMERIVDLAEGYREKDKGEFRFEKALRGGELSFICEVKKASPSQGVIAADFPYRQIAKEYEAAGASAISVLTEPVYFQGSDTYLSEIAGTVSLPLLRKDFVVDSYMIYEAKLMGASAVLLICAILDDDRLVEYLQIANKLGLSALVETHNEAEVKTALNAGARIIGVNNRDLETFTVDICTSERLRQLVPQEKIFVAESGIQTPDDVEMMRVIGVDAVLVGETLMRSNDKKTELAKLRGGL